MTRMTRSNKRLKEIHEVDMDDCTDDATVTHSNEDTRPYSFPHVSFLKLSVKVTKANKATAAMKSKFQDAFKCIRDADATAALSIFRTDPTPDATGKYVGTKTSVIMRPEDIPESITAMGKYFFGCRPRSDGGVLWSQIRLLHTEPIDNIIVDTRAEFQDIDGNLSIQAIQHWDVETIGFLKNLHPDVDDDSMQTFLTDEVNKLHSGEDPLLLGIKVRTPYDGTKKDPNTRVKFKDRIQAFHVDTLGSIKTTVQQHLKKVLASEDFKNRYTAPVRLVPTFDRRSSPNTQEKVKRCILQHSQFCQSVDSLPCQGISSLEHYNKNLKGTLRDLVMALPDTHFINIDVNWSNTNHVILFPRKYESSAKEKIVHLAAYLHKEYGKKILSSFDAATQLIVKETTWTTDGKPMSKLDRELDDMIAADDAIDYVDISFFASTQEKQAPPTTTASPFLSMDGPVPFVPVIDDQSVSTFGTAASKSPLKRTTSDENSSVTSATSLVSVLSRVSKVEDNMQDMKAMLQQLVSAQCKSSTASTPRSCSSKAGGSNGSPAGGV